MDTPAAVGVGAAHLSFPEKDVARVALSGDWLLEGRRPPTRQLLETLSAASGLRRLEYESGALGRWDTGLVDFAVRLERAVRGAGVEVGRGGLPAGARRLVDLAEATSQREGRCHEPRGEGILARVGGASSELWDDTVRGVDFLGRVALSLGRLLRGRTDFRPRDLAIAVQEAGAEALGLVGVLSVLAGIAVGSIASVQLSRPGAEGLAAHIVGPTMIRLLGPMLVGVVIASRSGAGYAARLGTMRANDEIDALRTLGVDPIDFLVVPRALALTLVTPLLTLYSVFLGIAGGAVVSLARLDLTARQYLTETRAALGLEDLVAGLLIALVCGPLVALVGCRRGFECGRGDGEVAGAVASAAVTGIVMIAIAGALLTLLYTQLGI